jgi:hypothetical protein
MPLRDPQPSTSPFEDGPDLAVRVADTVEQVATAVHNRLVRPLLLVARIAVLALVAFAFAAVAAVTAGIGLVRLLDVDAFGNRVWASDALVGVVFCLLGALAWRQRRPSPERNGES